MAHSDCGWTCGCAGKTVKSLENTHHTWALLRWWFTTKRRCIKCMHLYLYLYQRQTIRVFAVTTKETIKVPSWLEFWLRQMHVKWCRWERGALWFDWVPFYTRKREGPMCPPVTHSDRYVQRRDPDRAVKPPPLELPHRQDGDHMRRLAVLTANNRYVWRLRLRKLIFATGHFCCFRLSYGPMEAQPVPDRLFMRRVAYWNRTENGQPAVFVWLKNGINLREVAG